MSRGEHEVQVSGVVPFLEWRRGGAGVAPRVGDLLSRSNETFGYRKNSNESMRRCVR